MRKRNILAIAIVMTVVWTFAASGISSQGGGNQCEAKKVENCGCASDLRHCTQTQGGVEAWGKYDCTTRDSVSGICTKDRAKKFFGMFYSGAGADTEGIESLVTSSTQPDRLTVVQDYKSPREAASSIDSIVLAHQKGNVVHLNLMIEGNAWDAQVEQQIRTFGFALAQELLKTSIPGILITIGPEMNGTWTSYGCTGKDPNAEDFVLLHNEIESVLREEMQAAGVERSRMRIVWGPNVWPGPTDLLPCSYSVYWPGFSHVDFIGYSHYSFTGDYRSGQEIVETAAEILQAIGADPQNPANFGKVMILQTGMEYGQAGRDRGVWLQELFESVAAERLLSGIILFQSPDYGDRPEPRLRWLDYESLEPLEGFDQLRTEITDGHLFSTSADFLFRQSDRPITLTEE